ncbi:MAG: NADH dehydrogenase [Caldithrix sp. RBG_13_44_9]|nr:MAG: NADH dehydrogenase [Caldithrix sp. RBG_13_44_9]
MKMLLKKILKKITSPLLSKIHSLEQDIEQNRILLAQILIKELAEKKDPLRLLDVGFKVFSQWDEDGIIQYLISRVPIENKMFVEFGVEDYHESNTRFLLIHNNWRGLLIDGNPSFIERIKKSELYWRYDLTAINAFVTKDNINELISSNGGKGDIGLLSIDIDGNDYWIWQAINIISPRIVICEYNSIFGCKVPITVPYEEQFNRTDAHYSNLYFGASLKALCLLAVQKGYSFVGSNSAGSNAFFVRKDISSNLLTMDCQTGYVKSKARESRDKNGHLTYVSGDDRIKLIEHLKVFDVEKHVEKAIKEIFE